MAVVGLTVCRNGMILPIVDSMEHVVGHSVWVLLLALQCGHYLITPLPVAVYINKFPYSPQTLN